MNPMSRALGLVSLLLGAALLGGCGSSKDATEKRLGELRDEITRLQNTQDRLGERLMALEVQRISAEPSRPTAGPPALERPPLKVVRLAPDAAPAPPAEQSAAPAADEPRPVIKLTGDGKATTRRGPREPVANLRQD